MGFAFALSDVQEYMEKYFSMESWDDLCVLDELEFYAKNGSHSAKSSY